jgi:hypothetical protein
MEMAKNNNKPDLKTKLDQEIATRQLVSDFSNRTTRNMDLLNRVLFSLPRLANLANNVLERATGLDLNRDGKIADIPLEEHKKMEEERRGKRIAERNTRTAKTPGEEVGGRLGNVPATDKGKAEGPPAVGGEDVALDGWEGHYDHYASENPYQPPSGQESATVRPTLAERLRNSTRASEDKTPPIPTTPPHTPASGVATRTKEPTSPGL